tara:strand:- start:209 stop:451 length:243 start_codon:yes stop_codon:yes gene_type:complete
MEIGIEFMNAAKDTGYVMDKAEAYDLFDKSLTMLEESTPTTLKQALNHTNLAIHGLALYGYSDFVKELKQAVKEFSEVKC